MFSARQRYIRLSYDPYYLQDVSDLVNLLGTVIIFINFFHCSSYNIEHYFNSEYTLIIMQFIIVIFVFNIIINQLC